METRDEKLIIIICHTIYKNYWCKQTFNKKNQKTRKNQSQSDNNISHISDICSVAWQMSEAITFTIVQRENGLQHVKKMLEEGESDVKRTAVSLIRNLSRYQELHPNIGNRFYSYLRVGVEGLDANLLLFPL